MRGSPLFRAALAFFVIALTGFPLWKLTRERAAAAAPGPQMVESKELALALTFSTPPRSFAVRHLGKVLWAGERPAREAAQVVSLPYPPDGVDLEVEVLWPAEEPPAAVRITLTDPAGRPHEKTLWGRGPLDEVVTFP